MAAPAPAPLRRDRTRRRRSRRAVAVTALAVVAVSVSSLGAAFAAPDAASLDSSSGSTSGATLGAESAREVAALQRVKATASKPERKLDSQLLLAVRQKADAATLAAVPRLRLGVAVSAAGSTVVDLRVTRVTDDLLDRLKGAGALVTGVWPEAAVVRATVPLTVVTTVAGWSDVEHVSPPVGFRTQRAGGSTSPAPAGQGDQAEVVSEGDRADAAAQARKKYGVTGTGVKVCVLSDGVDSLRDSQTAGELPAVDVLPGQAGSGDEGTAMLEIVHDLAPNATLGFASAGPSEPQFAQNIRDLRSVGHCDVIVDDVVYYDESPFQDGPVARAVDAVHADGAVYLSSAGNEGNLLSGTSGTWEGDFADSGQGVGRFAGVAHDFDPGSGVQVLDPLSPNSGGSVTTLFWADPAGAAADDYDLYVLDSSGSVVALSQDVQDGDDNPFERLQVPLLGTGYRLAVVKYAGRARYLQVTAFGGRFASGGGLQAFATDGEQRGHADAEGAISVAAAPADEPFPRLLEDGDPPNPGGPYPQAFGYRQVPEPFTSDGPRRVFFEADGTPITPGNTTATGGEVRQKPEVLAADGVRTSVDGFDPFFGTSAAAPHAAAIAALVLSGNPGTDPDAVKAAMVAVAIDLRPLGFDPRSGWGAVRADKLLARTGATPQPLLTVGAPTVTPSSGDGDAFLEPGETATLTIPVADVGDGPARQVAASVATTEPGVTITPSARSYGQIKAGASASRTFTIALPASYPNGKPVLITVTASSANSASTMVTRTVPTGEPSTVATTVSYSRSAVAIPDDSETGVSVPLRVKGVGYSSSVRFSIDGTTCTTDEGATSVGIDHTFVGDLTGTLTAPDGATARLFSRSGSGGNNLCQVVFEDTATDPFDTVVSADAPFTGHYRPIDPLASLLGDAVDGTWSFTVTDEAPADTGHVRAFSLTFTGFEAP